jgi:hypothetical protein
MVSLARREFSRHVPPRPKHHFAWMPRLEFCTFRDRANPSIDGHCGAVNEFWRVSVQSRVVKNEMAIPALQQRYVTLYTPLAAC